MGTLHDIGRREGFSYMKHIIDGYNYMNGLGYNDAAKICLSHSFPVKEITSYAGKNDCTEEQNILISNFLKNTEYDIYDKLIQLSDALASDEGICALEYRMVDVIRRHGAYNFMSEKLDATFKIKEELEKDIGKNIYDLLNIKIVSLQKEREDASTRKG